VSLNTCIALTLSCWQRITPRSSIKFSNCFFFFEKTAYIYLIKVPKSNAHQINTRQINTSQVDTQQIKIAHHEILPRTPPPRQYRCRRPPLRHELHSRLWRQSGDMRSQGWSRHGRDLRRPRAACSDHLRHDICWLHEGLWRDCRSSYRIDGKLNQPHLELRRLFITTG
jgi:hypothetical protein